MQGGGLGFSKADFHADEFFLRKWSEALLVRAGGRGWEAGPGRPAQPAREA